MPPVLLCQSPYVPTEWVLAHGWLPHRAAPQPHAHRGGACAYAQSVAANEWWCAGGDAVAMAATCDRLRRACDMVCFGCYRPTVVLNPPADESASALAGYRDDLRRLGRLLVERGGHPPESERLADLLFDFDRRRALLRSRAGHLRARAYAEAVAHLLAGDDVDPPPPRAMSGPRIGVLGPHLGVDDRWVLDDLEEAGLVVALDATEGGEGALPAPVDRDLVAADPEAALVVAYAGIPEPLRQPNAAWYRWLEREVAARGLQGLVLWRPTACVPWELEAARLRRWAGSPLVELVAGDESGLRSRVRSRIAAFAEALRR